jgi:Domain of unknown function (DUF3303)
MRFVMQISLPAAKFNQAVRAGTAGETMRKILDETKPEAAYFTSQGGNRGGILIVDLNSASELPRLAEPWFLRFDANIEFHPAMTPEDLGAAGIDELGRKWG